MNIIFLTKGGICRRCFDIQSWRMRLVAALSLSLVVGLVASAGFLAGARHADPQQFIAAWEDEIRMQRVSLRMALESTGADIDALTIRLAEIQARAMRVDALGGKLVTMAGLDDGEFDFASVPGLGGPESLEPGLGQAPDLLAQLDALDSLLAERQSQLELLDRMILSRQLQEEVTPAGHPVTQGWISSNYGPRNDPFTGRRVQHRGVDFAGRPGSDVIAVAGGIVTWASKRNVFGNLVEIDHGNGYVTRYAHNKKLLVEAGATVRKGQVIALLGETGRATGPHVHFEVLENGRHINPSRFIRTSR